MDRIHTRLCDIRPNYCVYLHKIEMAMKPVLWLMPRPDELRDISQEQLRIKLSDYLYDKIDVDIDGVLDEVSDIIAQQVEGGG